MTELQLYKFLLESKLEFNFIDDDKEVMLFVDKWVIDDFMDLLSKHSTFLYFHGLNAVIKDTYLAVKMGGFCEYHSIELLNVFIKK
mgnify:CR=1 FL=1